MPNPSVANAFSLLELMICLSIAAVLALLSYPSLKSYIHHSYCLEAKLQLLEAATRIEDYYGLHQSYSGVSLQELGIPEWTEHKSHQLLLNTQTHSYELQALPQIEECEVYRLNQTGLLTN